MSSNRMSASAELGEKLYEAVTNDSIEDIIEEFGGREEAAKAIAYFSQGESADVLAYFEHNGY